MKVKKLEPPLKGKQRIKNKKRKIKSVGKNQKSSIKADDVYSYDIDEFIRITKKEVESIRTDPLRREASIPTASQCYLPDEGYIKEVSFTSGDLSEEKLFYFKEDQEVPECLLFNLLTNQAESYSADQSVVEDFNNAYNDKISDGEYVIKIVSKDKKWIDSFKIPDCTLLESAITTYLSQNIHRTYEEISKLRDNYKATIVNSSNYEKLLYNLARNLYGKSKSSYYLKASHTLSISYILTPFLFYTYPDEEKSVTRTSWPLLLQVA